MGFSLGDTAVDFGALEDNRVMGFRPGPERTRFIHEVVDGQLKREAAEKAKSEEKPKAEPPKMQPGGDDKTVALRVGTAPAFCSGRECPAGLWAAQRG